MITKNYVVTIISVKDPKADFEERLLNAVKFNLYQQGVKYVDVACESTVTKSCPYGAKSRTECAHIDCAVECV